jgi:para-aminobenzoate synthetase component 1
MAIADNQTVQLTLRDIELDCSPAGLLHGLSQLPDPVMLDSSAFHEQYGRYTVLACCPTEVLTLRDGLLHDSSGRDTARGERAIWDRLDEAFSRYRLAAPPPRIGYLPGWFGYVGYEVGRHVERLPGRARRDTPLPDMRLAFYDAVLVYDALRRTWALAELKLPARAGRSDAASMLADLAARSRNAPPHPRPPAAEHADAGNLPAASFESNFTPDEYRRAVRRAIEYIAAGDIFQVNLSQRFAVSDAPPPLDIYRVLRRRNPAWHAAYLAFESAGHRCAILSSSPELFLRVRDGRVLTRPIKGTRRRTGNVAADRAAMDDLWNCPKDNAELAMIIDLLRNDLGRTCRYGSIRVLRAREMETHPTVFHLTGSVEGVIREGVGAAQLLRATFPGGSITGAPKIRAMEIIDELESLARGVYTGCIGAVGVDGSCEWNIAIRTVVCHAPPGLPGRNLAYVQAGGGIVAESNDQAEYQETLDKARAMLEAIQQARVYCHP